MDSSNSCLGSMKLVYTRLALGNTVDRHTVAVKKDFSIIYTYFGGTLTAIVTRQ